MLEFGWSHNIAQRRLIWYNHEAIWNVSLKSHKSRSNHTRKNNFVRMKICFFFFQKCLLRKGYAIESDRPNKINNNPKAIDHNIRDEEQKDICNKIAFLYLFPYIHLQRVALYYFISIRSSRFLVSFWMLENRLPPTYIFLSLFFSLSLPPLPP